MDFQTASKLTDEQARTYLESLRWPNGPVCPHCGKNGAAKLNGKATRPGVHKCKNKECRKQFTVTVGTIFERSHIGLREWVMAFALVCASKKGISALQLQRMLGLKSYKSAWHLAQRIRHAMRSEPLRGMLAGTIEMDETYIGGRAPKMDRNDKKPRRIPAKTLVVALIERNGKMRAKAVDRVTGENLPQAVRESVDVMQSKLMTDELRLYRPIGERFLNGHETVCHSLDEYVRGDAHVNTCESWFALLKRGIHGSFHHVGKQHLQRYCDEFAFRWNHRKTTDAARTEAALRLAPGTRLFYRTASTAG